MIITARDMDVLARTVYGEARGEPDQGKLAVAWVVVNRARKHRISIAAAALKSIHFSCWNNARAMDANQLAMLTAEPGNPLFARCLIAALAAAHGIDPDPTGGARHYHAHHVRPRWSRGKVYLLIGGHRFYRDID